MSTNEEEIMHLREALFGDVGLEPKLSDEERVAFGRRLLDLEQEVTRRLEHQQDEKPVTDVWDENELGEAKAMIELVNSAGASFEQLCVERHEMGQKEYGAFTFLENDVVRMMIEELADTVNYCRYQAVKLMLLQEALEKKLAGDDLVGEGEEQITLGVQAFKGVGEVGWK